MSHCPLRNIKNRTQIYLIILMNLFDQGNQDNQRPIFRT